MYKIKREENGKFTVKCYIYSENSHSNQELWSASNIDECGVAQFMNIEKDAQTDFDFGFELLKSGNGPALLTDEGVLLPAPVKTGQRNDNVRARAILSTEE